MDELFFSGTAVEIARIGEVDGRKIGNGDSPMTAHFHKLYNDATHGKIKRYENWLRYVK